jgi:hypothetical protein
MQLPAAAVLGVLCILAFAVWPQPARASLGLEALEPPQAARRLTLDWPAGLSLIAWPVTECRPADLIERECPITAQLGLATIRVMEEEEEVVLGTVPVLEGGARGAPAAGARSAGAGGTGEARQAAPPPAPGRTAAARGPGPGAGPAAGGAAARRALGALDAKIRRQLRLELKSLQEEVGTTFIFVTHDQEEALSMSDRIAVMQDGHVDQIGTPREVYESPATLFVADFLGVANTMSVEALGATANGCSVRVGEFTLEAGCGDLDARGEARAVVRPERLEVRDRDSDQMPNCLPGMVDRTVFVGEHLQVMVRLATGDLLQASVPNEGEGLDQHGQGSPVSVHIPPDALRVLRSS